MKQKATKRRYRVRPVSYVLEEEVTETTWRKILGPEEDCEKLVKLCLHLTAGETEDLPQPLSEQPTADLVPGPEAE